MTALAPAAIGVLVAVAITSAMDATGLSTFSALPLLPLLLLFAYLQRLSRAELGFVGARPRHWGLALVHPAVVLGAIAIAAWATRAIDLASTNWQKALLNSAVVSASTFLVTILTEEGFFRGWLWASLKRAGLTDAGILVASSLAFSIWHWSAVLLDTGFAPPRQQVPVYLLNATLLGVIWGLLRWASGSVLVASLGHGVWNGIAYVFFGFGTRNGALGIRDTGVYGPEVGLLGLILNALFAIGLWRWHSRRVAREATVPYRAKASDALV